LTNWLNVKRTSRLGVTISVPEHASEKLLPPAPEPEPEPLPDPDPPLLPSPSSPASVAVHARSGNAHSEM
jgi:hypothetical protein